MRTDSEPFAEWLDSTFSEFRSSEEVGPQYSVIVPETAGGPVRKFNMLYRDTTTLSKTLDLVELVEMLRSEFESYLFADWNEAIYAEAAIATSNGLTALLPSAYGLYLNGQLAELKKDERPDVSVQPGGRIVIDIGTGRISPVPPTFALSESAVAELARIAPTNGRRRATRTAGPTAVPESVDLICQPYTGLGERTHEPMSRALAVAAISDQVSNLDKLGARALEGLARVAESSSCYALTLRGDLMLTGLVEAFQAESKSR